jgi:hypothetical protein
MALRPAQTWRTSRTHHFSCWLYPPTHSRHVQVGHASPFQTSCSESRTDFQTKSVSRILIGFSADQDADQFQGFMTKHEEKYS